MYRVGIEPTNWDAEANSLETVLNGPSFDKLLAYYPDVEYDLQLN